MIDLSIDINDYNFKKYIKPYIKPLDTCITYWESSKFASYRYNFVREGYMNPENLENNKPSEIYSYYFAYSLNTTADYSDRFRLSFNPNKVPLSDPLLKVILNYMKDNKRKLKISTVDVAVDYTGISTNDLILDKGSKKVYSYYYYPESDRTIYIGKPGKGQVKVYDKASEQGIDGLKTRYEITLNVDSYYSEIKSYKVKESIPKLYVKHDYNILSTQDLTDFEKMLVYSVQNGFNLNELSYRNRKKYESIMNRQKDIGIKIEPDQLALEQAIKKFVESIF